MNINLYSPEMRLFITMAMVLGPALLAGALAEYHHKRKAKK